MKNEREEDRVVRQAKKNKEKSEIILEKLMRLRKQKPEKKPKLSAQEG